MQILSVRSTAQKKVLKEAVRVLKKGGVVAIPTETTYGLVCDPRNAKAVRKIFRIKGRDEGKPLQLIAASRTQVTALAALNPFAKKSIMKHWPGPLTLLLPLKKGIRIAPKVSPKRTIGIRVSSAPIVRALARAFAHPVAGTSANRSGNTPAFSSQGVVDAFKDYPAKPDLLIDAGSIPRNKPSTVARIHDDGRVEIFRQGAIRLVRLPPKGLHATVSLYE